MTWSWFLFFLKFGFKSFYTVGGTTWRYNFWFIKLCEGGNYVKAYACRRDFDQLAFFPEFMITWLQTFRIRDFGPLSIFPNMHFCPFQHFNMDQKCIFEHITAVDQNNIIEKIEVTWSRISGSKPVDQNLDDMHMPSRNYLLHMVLCCKNYTTVYTWFWRFQDGKSRIRSLGIQVLTVV